LLLRAERLRRRPESADQDAALWLAEFPLGEERYAIRLDALRACVPLRRVRSVPLAPAYVIGILHFEGQLVTAMSLAARLGVRGWRRDPTILLIVELGPGRLAAIDAEAIPRPIALSRDLAETVTDAQESGVSEVLLGDGKPLNLVDMTRLFADSAQGSRVR
jgi:purine-binding chemotaxis protein CheW